jgi:hypothetical protein
MAKIKLDKAAIQAIAKAHEVKTTGGDDRPAANTSVLLASGMHDALGAYLVAADKADREPKGLGVLAPLSELDPKKWEAFIRKNPTVTIRMEDRSERGFPRIVTGYQSGSVVYQFVAPVNKADLVEAMA